MAMRRDTTSDRQRVGDGAQQRAQGAGVAPAAAEAAGVLANALAGFDQAAIGPLPAGGQQDPVMHQQAQQLGVPHHHQARRVTAPGLVKHALD